jgi:hypothetical protein
MVKGRKFTSKTFSKRIQNNEKSRTVLSVKLFCKNQGGGGRVVKTAVGSELSLVGCNYYENKVSVVIEMTSFCLLTLRGRGYFAGLKSGKT